MFIPLPEESKNKKYQEEVSVYVTKWITFKELVIVLRANLQEIVDRYKKRELLKSPLKRFHFHHHKKVNVSIVVVCTLLELWLSFYWYTTEYSDLSLFPV